MYRFDFVNVNSYDKGYYVANIGGISTDLTHIDNNLRMNFKVDVLNLKNLNIDEDNPLSLLNANNYSSITDNLTTNLTLDDGVITMQFESVDLDEFVDSEIRPKFPGENVTEFKIQFIEDLCKFISEKGID